MIIERAETLSTRDGVTLEASIGLPSTAPGGVVICHPHPLYGGDMDNPVVVRVAEVCRELGLATLRFNFRGVGASTGRHGEGRDERHDVVGALTHLASVLPAGVPLVLAGYSFGATVSARVASEPSDRPPLAAVALIAPPLAMTGEESFAELAHFGIATLVVAGDHDDYCPLPALHALGRRIPSAEIKIVEGANHFFFGKLYPLGQAVEAWGRTLEARQAGRSRGTG
ncbi:MAG: alpha/beta hydrolase [Candidatus Rokuibacteriota bacterium]|nr:MAG: alpha/beta hydrolase [Candidatus Rokubacteria bacterium]